MSSRATAGDVRAAVDAVLAEAGWQWDDVDVVATRAWLAGDHRLAALGKPVTGFDDDALAAVDGRATAGAPADGPPPAGGAPIAELDPTDVPSPAAAPTAELDPIDGPPAAGTPTAAHGRSVAEPAALLAAGAGGRLVVPKRTGTFVTVAAATGSP